jgi:hypothetical protein
MAISEVYTISAATISTSEYSIVNGGTTLQNITDDGIYQLFLDLSDMVDGDILELKIYEKVTSGATKRVVHYETLAHDQGTAENYASPSLILMHGWDMTLKRIGGTDVSVTGSIRKIA